MSLDAGLNLDDRHRAMLEEMGVPVWQPRFAPVAATVDREALPVPAPIPASPVPASPPPAIRTPAPVAAPSGSAPTYVKTNSLDWDQLESAMAQALGVGIEQLRRNALLGVGNRTANWLFVGEAPDDNEDTQGDPVVGQAGKLFDNMLRSVGLDRDQVFMVNVPKQPGAKASGDPFLRRQIELVRPKGIFAMGRFAAQAVLADGAPELSQLPLGKLRGQVHSVVTDAATIPVVVSYHPAYLLRSVTEKPKAWADLCLALAAFK